MAGAGTCRSDDVGAWPISASGGADGAPRPGEPGESRDPGRSPAAFTKSVDESL